MFTPQGTWVPDQPINNQVPNQNMGAVPQMRPAMQFNPQAPMQFNPQFNPQFGGQMTMKGAGGPTGFGGGPGPNLGNNYINMNNPVTTTVPQAQAAQNTSLGNSRTQIGPASNPEQFNDPYQTPQALAPVYSPQQMPLSMTQSVNHANPQNVQNYLKALHNSPQAAQGNAWRNPAGMQGQQAQAGFQGFQQNGVAAYGQQAAQFNQYAGNTQLSNANTRVNPGQQSFAQTGQGGMPGMPQYQQGGNIPDYSSTPPRPQNTYQNEYPKHQSEDTPTKKGSGNYPGGGKYGGDNANTETPPQDAFSDINVKQDIRKGDAQLQEFLDSLGVYDYEYKDPKYGEGRRISPMAQEIEKTPLGKAAISTNDEGYKIVDYGKLGGTMLASLAMLNHKYNELEESIKNGLKSKGKIK